MDLVIRGGSVATSDSVRRLDVGIREGRIAALEPSLDGREVLDASGKLVLPGGIDSHCHIAQLSSSGIETADDFRSGTRSALHGGTTMIIPFAAQHRGQSLEEVVDAYHVRAREALSDYSFHVIVSDADLDAMRRLIRKGCTSFKVYMTYEALRLPDDQILEILKLTRDEGALLMVHAENHEMIFDTADRLLAEGKTAPRYHSVAHSAESEREATARAIALAEKAGAPILIVHVSSRLAIEEIRRARARGARVFAETCPQYLFLSEEDLARGGFEGAKFMCSPPPRDPANQEQVWQALADGTIDLFSSDHSPYRFDVSGKKRHGEDAPFTKVANGVPGLEVRMALLYSEGVRSGRLTLERFVALTSTRHAKIYGLYPQKGALEVGSDADVTIWDPEARVTISADMLHDNMDYTPYEGREVQGWPVRSLVRGAEPAGGRFIARS